MNETKRIKIEILIFFGFLLLIIVAIFLFFSTFLPLLLQVTKTRDVCDFKLNINKNLTCYNDTLVTLGVERSSLEIPSKAKISMIIVGISNLSTTKNIIINETSLLEQFNSKRNKNKLVLIRIKRKKNLPTGILASIYIKPTLTYHNITKTCGIKSQVIMERCGKE